MMDWLARAAWSGGEAGCFCWSRVHGLTGSVQLHQYQGWLCVELGAGRDLS
jgi:hypothetical protein